VIEEGGKHEQGSVWSWYSVGGFRGGGLRRWGGGSPSPTEQPTTLPDLGRDRKLASVQAQRAMEEGCMVFWGLRWEET
jgi:hypothetical protein